MEGMMRIKNLSDLAQYLGAGEATMESIAHRLYKDTACGISFSVVERAETAEQTFWLRFRRSIGGTVVNAWRVAGGAWQPVRTMPQVLRDFVMLDARETPGGTLVLEPEAAAAVASSMRYTVALDAPTGKVRTVLCFAGYAEGTDAECPAHEVVLPASSAQVEAAVKAADSDGCELFNATHCDDCGAEGLEPGMPCDCQHHCDCQA